MFKQGFGDWVKYRELNAREADFHHEPGESDCLDYHQRMEKAKKDTLSVLKKAQEDNVPWVLLVHGKSTSRPGKTTIRSTIRNVMRSKEATPYIIRKECIQHATVFVAVIRPPKKS